MKTIIAGGRDINDIKMVEAAVWHCPWTITEVVSGAARGVDHMGECWARQHGIPVERHPADWNTHGKAAGPIRNAQMADYADALILIWDGKSRGSASMKREAQKRGLKIYEHIIT